MLCLYYLGLGPHAHGVNSSTFRTWHNTTITSKLPSPDVSLKNKLKNDFPKLHNYELPPARFFWDAFPSRDVPDGPSTPIDVKAFRDSVLRCRSQFSSFHDNMARQVISDLEIGADTLTQLHLLPPVHCENPIDFANHEVCHLLTDQIGSWVAKGYACGPFSEPPMGSFRVNPLFAHVKRERFVRF